MDKTSPNGSIFWKRVNILKLGQNFKNDAKFWTWLNILKMGQWTQFWSFDPFSKYWPIFKIPLEKTCFFSSPFLIWKHQNGPYDVQFWWSFAQVGQVTNMNNVKSSDEIKPKLAPARNTSTATINSYSTAFYQVSLGLKRVTKGIL